MPDIPLYTPDCPFIVVHDEPITTQSPAESIAPGAPLPEGTHDEPVHKPVGLMTPVEVTDPELV